MDFGIPYFHPSGYQLGPYIFSLGCPAMMPAAPSDRPCQRWRLLHAAARPTRRACFFAGPRNDWWIQSAGCVILEAFSHLYYHLEYLEVVTIHHPLHFGMIEIGSEAYTLNCWQMLFHMFLLKSVLVARCCCSVTFMGSLSFLDTQNSSDDASIVRAEKTQWPWSLACQQ